MANLPERTVTSFQLPIPTTKEQLTMGILNELTLCVFLTLLTGVMVVVLCGIGYVLRMGFFLARRVAAHGVPALQDFALTFGNRNVFRAIPVAAAGYRL
jgi:hypothetical protein